MVNCLHYKTTNKKLLLLLCNLKECKICEFALSCNLVVTLCMCVQVLQYRGTKIISLKSHVPRHLAIRPSIEQLSLLLASVTFIAVYTFLYF